MVWPCGVAELGADPRGLAPVPTAVGQQGVMAPGVLGACGLYLHSWRPRVLCVCSRAAEGPLCLDAEWRLQSTRRSWAVCLSVCSDLQGCFSALGVVQPRVCKLQACPPWLRHS